MQFISIDSNDASEKNNSVVTNAEWSLQQTLNKWIEVRQISCQVKSSW